MGQNPRPSKFWLIISRDALLLSACAIVVAVVGIWGPSFTGTTSVFRALSAVADGDLPVANSVMASGANASVQTQLEEIAKRFDAPPVNARADSVWRLIPGVNGVRLNMQQTLKNPNATPLVFDQIPPAISLNDFVAQPIYRGNPLKRQMALMINVAWGSEYLNPILHILKQNHVKATFFLDGSWTTKNAAMARQIENTGMELGNHAFNHPNMSRLSRTAMISQIQKTNAAIEAATGVKPTLFAPPSGDFNDMVVRVAAGLNMRTILWTLDTVDWRRPSPQVILRRIVNKRTPGALVLMHPTAPTVAALPELIQSLRRDGYQLVTVSTLLSPLRPVPKTIAEALSTHR
ncbi:MAG: polysaccharide deacetylase family protein [Firmicutes bacterium]|nr:polysaccharide deacetylase family protein [Bacillota bacterium]